MKALSLLLASFVVAVAPAQEMDMTPPKELKQVEFFVGKWTGEETFHMGGPPQKVSATITGSKVAGDRWIQGLHKSTMAGMPPFEGVHMLSYDPEIKKYRAWWFDNAGPGSQAMELEGTMTGNTLVMTSKPTPMPGMAQPTTFRATWNKKSEKEMTFTLEIQAGSAWNKVIEGNYRKLLG